MRRFGLILVTTTALTGLAGAALANPTGGVVSAGSASIASSGTTLTVTQSSSKAIINWGTFNIGQNETTNFVQPSSSSIALNRINDINPSTIAGNLDANGHIILINPNGVIFSGTAHVDVAGITATTANIADADFMAGNYNFSQPGSPNGAVINQGSITVEQAGLASLVAPQVENDGVITAKLGRINLASGDTFTLDLAGDGAVQVAVSSSQLPIQKAINTGTLSANGGTVTITAAAARDVVDDLITNTGVIQADTMSGKAGSVTLYASGGRVNNSGVIYARGQNAGESGGTVSITADSVQHSGTIDVSGQAKGGTVNITAANDYSDTAASAIHADSAAGQGGSVTISAATVTTNGTITANGITGGSITISGNTVNQYAALQAIGINAGGTVNISFSGLYADSTDSLITTAATNGSGGTIVVEGSDNASLYAEGSYIASGQTTGGTINLLAGQDIFLLGAFLSGEGGTQGGEIRIGGDLHGGGTLRRSQYTYIDGNTLILDSATGNGDGGEVVVWSDAATYFGGTIDATGAGSGSGGFVETSSHNLLTPDGIVNVGKGGTWLLDPADLTITTSTGAQVTSSGTNPITWATTSSATSGSDSYLNASTVASELSAGTNVIIETSTNGSGGNGDIFVGSAITSTGAGNLTLSAYRNITVSAAITTQGGSVTLDADNAGNHSGYINVAANITTNGGNITMGGGSGTITAGSGYAWGNSGQASGVQIGYPTDSSTVTINAGTGNIIINGQGYNNASGSNNYGVYFYSQVHYNAYVETTSGNITINGIGGNGVAGNDGVYISGSYPGTSALVTTTSGTINITGTGGTGGTTSSFTGNDGVVLAYDGAVSSTGTGSGLGSVNITGYGANGYSGNMGVDFSQYTNHVSSVDANINITGTGGDGAADSNYGVFFQNAGGSFTASGKGALTIDGTGGSGTISNYGVVFSSNDTISVNTGALTVVGIGGAGGTSSGYNGNSGIYFNYGSEIQSTGTGTGVGAVTMTGTGAAGDANNYGIDFDYDPSAAISVKSANVVITGTGGNGTSTGNYGTYFVNYSGTTPIAVNGSGNITLTSVGKNGATDLYNASGGANTQTIGGVSDAGNITLNQDTASWGDLDIQTTGSVTVAPNTTSTTIGFGGTNATGTLQITQALMDDINAPTVTIGSLTGTGLLTTNAFNWEHTLTTLNLESGGAAGAVTISGAITKGVDDGSVANSTDGTLNIYSGSNIIVNNAISSSSTYGKLNILLDANYANASSGYIDVAANITSNNGYVTMGGGNGTITAGSGYAWGNAGQAAGVQIGTGSGTVMVSTGSGNIIVNGQGYNNASGSNNYGIYLNDTIAGWGSTDGLQTTSGNITVNGTGGNGVADNYGVALIGRYADNANGVILTTSGAISIAGTGGTGGTTSSYINNDGVFISSGVVQSTGTGASLGSINITGTGAAGYSANYGVASGGDTYNGPGGGSWIRTADANITVTGTGGNGAAGSNLGVYMVNYGGGAIQSTGAGNVTVKGYGGAVASSNDGIYDGSIISTTSGALDVEGYGGAGTTGNDGIALGGTGTITTTNGLATITGVGGAGGTTSSYHDDYGIYMGYNCSISSTGSGSGLGTVTITATGAAAYSNNYGLFSDYDPATAFATKDANMVVNATGGNGTSTGNDGTYIRSYTGTEFAGTGSGSFTLTSTGVNGATDLAMGNTSYSIAD